LIEQLPVAVQDINTMKGKTRPHTFIANTQSDEISQHVGDNFDMAAQTGPPMGIVKHSNAQTAAGSCHGASQASQAGTDHTHALQKTGHDTRTWCSEAS
jgi:hypothetical protein